MNPACDVAPDELIAYTEEDLPERRMKELEVHVPACPVCQQRLTGAAETMSLLRESMPEPSSASRHDLLVRLSQETAQQTDYPHRNWTQVASFTAVSGTFLLAAVLLWSGLSQFVDALPRPFQHASPVQSQEWITETGSEAELFETAPLPSALDEEYPLHDHWVQSGIRLIVYQRGDSGRNPIEVSQFPVDDAEPPGYMEQVGSVDDIAIYVDDPDFVREIRWTQDGMAHHVQIYVQESDGGERFGIDETEAIVRAFLDS